MEQGVLLLPPSWFSHLENTMKPHTSIHTPLGIVIFIVIRQVIQAIDLRAEANLCVWMIYKPSDVWFHGIFQVTKPGWRK